MALVERAVRRSRNGYVTLTPISSPLAPVTAVMLGASRYEDGSPRWNTLERPRRTSVLEWAGRDIVRQSMTLMFSGEMSAQSGEPADITAETVKLHALAGGDARTFEPPKLRISGPVYGIGEYDQWVIESLDVGEPRRRLSDNRVCQVQYVVHLAQHFTTDIVSAVVSPAAAADAVNATAAAPVGRTHVVVRGDTLSRIAQRELGSAGRWPEIAKLNDLRDPNRLTVGQILNLPG